MRHVGMGSNTSPSRWHRQPCSWIKLHWQVVGWLDGYKDLYVHRGKYHESWRKVCELAYEGSRWGLTQKMNAESCFSSLTSAWFFSCLFLSSPISNPNIVAMTEQAFALNWSRIWVLRTVTCDRIETWHETNKVHLPISTGWHHAQVARHGEGMHVPMHPLPTRVLWPWKGMGHHSVTSHSRSRWLSAGLSELLCHSHLPWVVPSLLAWLAWGPC